MYIIHVYVTYAVWILLSDACSQVWKGLSLPLPHLWPLCGSCWVSHVEFLVLVKCLLLSEWLVTEWCSSLVADHSQILPFGCEMYKAMSVLEGEHCHSFVSSHLVLQFGDIPTQPWAGQVSQIPHYWSKVCNLTLCFPAVEPYVI